MCFKVFFICSEPSQGRGYHMPRNSELPHKPFVGPALGPPKHTMADHLLSLLSNSSAVHNNLRVSPSFRTVAAICVHRLPVVLGVQNLWHPQ